MIHPEKFSKRILIVRMGAIGDVLMATPLITALRNEFPDYYLGFLTSHYAIPVLEYNKEIDALYAIRYRKLPYLISMEKHRLVREMNRERWDAIFLLEDNPIFGRLIKKLNTDNVYGFNGKINSYLTRHIPFSSDSHVISNFLKLGSLLGKELKEFPMNLPWSDDASEKAKSILKRLPDNSPKIAIHAGFGPARKKGKKAIGIKSWPLEKFKETMIILHNKIKASFILTGSLKEFEINEVIIKGLKIPAINLAGQTTVSELGAILKEMDMVISIDSSPAHIAAAVGTPLIVLWGPSIEIKMKPKSLNSPVVIINKHLPCSPCYETPRMKRCSNNICMKWIQMDEVVREAINLLIKNKERND